MLADELRLPLTRVAKTLAELRADPVAMTDRPRWLGLFDDLDVLRANLIRGGGRGWPADVRRAYVAVRAGVTELYELLFKRPRPAVRYAAGRLAVYDRRLRTALARHARTAAGRGL